MGSRKSIKKNVLAVLVSIVMIFTMAPAAFMMSTNEVVADSGESGKITGNNILKSVEFGSYPQTEIVSKASDSGVNGRPWATATDYIVDQDLYTQLKTLENWDKNDDVTIAGNKYHRLKKSGATYTEKQSLYYKWANSTTYHYFKYEPIKWKVLDRNGNNVFLMAETALDCQRYEKKAYIATWATSSLRTWLNKTFLNRAFTTDEKDAIFTTTVENKNNLEYKTKGGKNTQDKVYLLSESEVYTDNAVKYGFDSDCYTYDKARRAKSSTYAKAMGTASDTSKNNLGNCNWWLRSPGDSEDASTYISYGGLGAICNVFDNNSVRPVLHLDLDKTTQYILEKGDVEITSNNVILKSSVVYDGKEKNPAAMIKGLTKGRDFSVAYSDNVNLGTATVTITGNGEYSGTVTKQFRIVSPSFSKKTYAVYKDKKIKVSLRSFVPDEITFTSSNSKIATVNSKGTVTGKKPGTVTITASADNVNAKCTVKVKKQDVKASKVVLENGGAKKRIKVLGAVGKTKFKSANSKVATVSSKGVVKAKKIGKTYIIVKNNGYTMHVKVYVKHYKPRYLTGIYDYNADTNVFTIDIENKGKKSITVYPYKAVEYHYENKTYHRYMTLISRNKTVKPGKTRYLNFKVKGKTTWWKTNYFSIIYYIKCDGKYYKVRAYEEYDED